MNHHLLAMGASALDASAGLVTLTAIADGLLRFNSNVLQLTEDWKILSTYAGGVGLTRARLNTAGNRLRGFPNLTPLNGSVLAGSRPGISDLRDFPLELRAMENASFQVTNGAANDIIILANMTRESPNLNINRSGLRKVRFSASLTSIAFGWSPEANVTLEDDIEAGRYNVYGMEVYEADCVAARLVFKDQVERPGCPAQQLVSDISSPVYMGGLGLWGSFDSITPPFIQAIHVAAAAQTLAGYLLIAKA